MSEGQGFGHRFVLRKAVRDSWHLRGCSLWKRVWVGIRGLGDTGLCGVGLYGAFVGVRCSR